MKSNGLSRFFAAGQNNPVLLGEAGVGKTAIVEGLAQESPKAMSRNSCARNALLRWTSRLMVAGTKISRPFGRADQSRHGRDSASPRT